MRNPESRAHEKCEDEDAEQSTLAGVGGSAGERCKAFAFFRSELLRYILVQTVLSFVADSSPWCSVSKFRLIGSYLNFQLGALLCSERRTGDSVTHKNGTHGYCLTVRSWRPRSGKDWIWRELFLTKMFF